MPTVFDRAEIDRVSQELADRRRECDNGEGMFCSTVQERIAFFNDQCGRMTRLLDRWEYGVFRGEIAFDVNDETTLKESLAALVASATDVAAEGRDLNRVCYELEGLSGLESGVNELDYRLRHWVRPALAASPSVRVRIPDDTADEMRAKLAELK